MSLYRRKNSPYWWVSLPPIAGEGGKRLQESTGTADRRKAEEFHDRLKAQRWEQVRLGVKPRHLWDEACLKFLEEIADKRHVKNDTSDLRWLYQHLGGKHLDEIDRALIDHIKAERLKIASKATANRYLSLIRRVLRKAVNEWEWIDRAPHIRLFREDSGRVRSLTKDEFWRLHGELPQHLADMALFSVATGLRQGNVKGLRWSHIDLENRHAWIDADQHKNGHAHSVRLGSAAMDVLLRLKGQHLTHVFVYDGHPIEQVNTKAWRAALKRAGIEDFRWHDLRHTWATWERKAGVPTYVLQRLGGWKTSAMVERYAHVASDDLRDYAARVDNVLGYTAATLEPLRKTDDVVYH